MNYDLEVKSFNFNLKISPVFCYHSRITHAHHNKSLYSNESSNFPTFHICYQSQMMKTSGILFHFEGDLLVFVYKMRSLVKFGKFCKFENFTTGKHFSSHFTENHDFKPNWCEMTNKWEEKKKQKIKQNEKSVQTDRNEIGMVPYRTKLYYVSWVAEMKKNRMEYAEKLSTKCNLEKIWFSTWENFWICYETVFNFPRVESKMYTLYKYIHMNIFFPSVFFFRLFLLFRFSFSLALDSLWFDVWKWNYKNS